MNKYEVVTPCYVPVGPGLKYKKIGQVVTLDDDDAAELAGFVTPVGVAKRNTPVKRRQAELPAEPPEEVCSDDGEPTPAYGRAGTEAEQ